jgi:uncharacterized protein
MRPIQVHSTKYDQSLHYQYPMFVVHATDDLMMTYVPPGVDVLSYRGEMKTLRHTLALFWANRPYNLHVNWRADWVPQSHYVNVATPATWNNTTIQFVDLDLDVIWRNDGSLILDDEDEFELHCQSFGYPETLVHEAWRSRDEICQLIQQRIYPFDGSLYAWRPDGTL